MIDAYTNRGNSVLEQSKQSPVMLVFLRHFGCNFCRETLDRIAGIKEEVGKNNTNLILVHQSSRDYADRMLELYDLTNIEHISDVNCLFYKSFGLDNHGYLELLKPKVIMGVIRSILKGHFPGSPKGNPTQMPGIFVLKNEEVIASFEYKNIAEIPPLLKLAS